MSSKKPSKSSKNKQQKVFGRTNPLEKRLGKSFFDKLPRKPGIYKMISRSGEILYVGKAKNLRERLMQYRRSNHQMRGRKSRMIFMIDQIEIEVFENERDALLRENELLRQVKPEYNVAKKHPESYYFIGLKREHFSFIFKLTMQYMPDRFDAIFGAFKGHRLIRSGMGALLRQLWLRTRDKPTAFHFPAVLTKNLTADHFTLKLPEHWPEASVDNYQKLVKNYLAGSGMELIRYLGEEARKQELLDGFLGKVILRDLDFMKKFYDKCARRNYLMYKTLALDSPTIPQNRLDDCLVRYAFEKSGN